MLKKALIFMVIVAASITSFTKMAMAEDKKRVVLLPFDSGKNKKGTYKIRTFIKNLLKSNFDYLVKKDIKEAEGEIDFYNIKPPKIKDICAKFGVTAFISGKMVRKSRRKYIFTSIIYSWEEGKPIFEKEFVLRRYLPTQKDLEKIAMATLKKLLAMQQFKQEEEKKEPQPEKVETETKDEEDEKLEDPIDEPIVKKKFMTNKLGYAPFSAKLSLGFIQRNLDFEPATEPYYKTTSPSFSPFLSFEVYPGAFSKPESIIAHFGLILDAFYLPGFKSYPHDDDNNKINTMVYNFGASLVYLHQLNQNLFLKPFLGFGMREWSFEQEDTLDVPSVSYSYLRTGTMIGFKISDKAQVEGKLAILLPLDAGEVVEGDYYGQASLWGIQTSVGFSYKILKHLALTADFEYNNFSFSFDKSGYRTADSASDQYIIFTIGGKYSF
ncbi:MAG: hypothetical protein ACQES9_04190 [Myxococcota bacterium]